MSRWTTLNIEGISIEEVPELFDDWWGYEEDGLTVIYSFGPGISPEEAANELVKVGDHSVESPVESIVSLQCDDTSDFVRGTLYLPRELKWNGVKPGVHWSGHHTIASEDSQFLDRAPEGRKLVFAGNWQNYVEGEPPAQELSKIKS